MTLSVVARKLRSGMHHHQAGDVAAAQKSYADVLKLQPENADALHLSGLLAHTSGDDSRAELLIDRAIRLRPDAAEFKVNLAAILVGQKRCVEAAQICRTVLQKAPDNVGALTHLGTALRQQQRAGEALTVFQSAVKFSSDATTLTNLASVLIDLGKFDAAYDKLLRARELSANSPQIHINLAVVESKRGDDTAALRSLQTAELLAPNSIELHINRGNLLLQMGELVKAVQSFQTAIAINSSSAGAVAGLGRALERIGFWEESLEAHRLASELDLSSHSRHSNYLFSCCLSPLLSYTDVHRAHVAWGQRVEQETKRLSHNNDLQPDRTLRIGYVSPDFRDHATMKFLFPLLESHDRSQFRLCFYSQTARGDAVTEAVRRLSDSWCDTRALSDDQLAEQVQSDGIDILVDLAGHTAENRLAVFARKPAPVQVSFLGYPFTTGLSSVDYYLTDGVRDPVSTDSLFVEELVRLPHGGCCFRSGSAPDIGPLPLRKNGFVTLGSTHRLEKISTQSLVVWSRVMALLPDARLLVFRDVLHNEGLRAQTLERMTHAGIDPQQVRFAWDLPDPHLKAYDDIDILLDVFPWGSGTTGFDAMWMGVPVPTIAGDRSSSRGAASLVCHSGFPELAAADVDEYLQLVCSLAADSKRLNTLRQELRPAMEASVCNAAQFAEDVETEYRKMWRRYVDV